VKEELLNLPLLKEADEEEDKKLNIDP